MSRVLLSLLWVFGFGLWADTWTFEAPPSQYYSQTVNADWRNLDKLGLTLELVSESPEHPLLLSLFLETHEGYWLESSKDLILQGGVQRFDLSLRDDSLDWRMIHGDRVFGKDLLRRVKRWGLRVYSAHPVSGMLKIGRLELQENLSQKNPKFLPRELPDKAFVGQNTFLKVEPWNWQGDLFATDQSPVFEIRSAKGSRFLPSVGIQEYRTRFIPGQSEARSFPWRRPIYRAKWIPEEEGLVEILLHPPEVIATEKTVSLGKINVESTAATPEPSFSGREIENHSFWKKVSPETVVWQKNPSGTTWDSAQLEGLWTPRLDWTSEWGTYAGLGEFMQPRASEFEETLSRSVQSGPIRIVTENILNNQSQLNWNNHPWNAANGGVYEHPSMLWTDPAWMDLVVRRAVYVWHRYGAYPQATGLYIEIHRASALHEDWIRQLTKRLQEKLPGVKLFCPSPTLPQRRVTGLLNTGSEGWHKPDELYGAANFIATDTPGEVFLFGASSQGFDASVEQMQHWSQREVLQIDVEPQFSDDVFPAMQLHVRTGPDRVFASKVFDLHNREPNRVFIDLQDSSAWTCFQEPEKEWTALERMNIREVTLRVYSDQPDPEATFRILQAQTVSYPLGLKEKSKPMELQHLRQPPDNVPTLTMQEWIFELNRFFQNPYDPEEISVDLHLSLPDGRKVSQPGFFYQDVQRNYENGLETWTLTDHVDWRVRFRPWMDGEHTWELRIVYSPLKNGPPEVLVRNGSFLAKGLDGAKGFVRRSTSDPRFFEFQNGEFFFPLGHTMRSPTDRRGGIYTQELRDTLDAKDAQGTEVYADWFERMQKNGGNFARIWISNWWLGLEWNSRHTGYHGRKYFNQANAARLDRILDLAEQHHMYLNLETTNHGTFSSKVDPEWDENPWSVFSPDEGPLTYASEFVISDEAKKWHEHKLRYLIARTGHSPSIAFWGVLTESEWTEAYSRSFQRPDRKPEKFQPQPYRSNAFREPFKQWTDQTTRFIKEANSHPSITTTHFSNPKNGLDFWRLPEVEVVYNNAYSGFFDDRNPEPPKPDPDSVNREYPEFEKRRNPYQGIVQEIYGYADYFRPWARDDKVLLVGEWGGRSQKNQDEHLIAEFHSGLWTSLVTELSGASGFWWYNLVDYHDLFTRYRAASAFMKDVDLRGKNFKQSRWAVWFDTKDLKNSHIRLAVGKSNNREAMGYIYSTKLSHRNRSRAPDGFEDPQFPESGTGWLLAPESLEKGTYRVEFWNTFSGVIFKEHVVTLHPQNREIEIPSHHVDLAVKIKYEGTLPASFATPMPTLIPVKTPVPTPRPTPPPPPTATPLPPNPF